MKREKATLVFELTRVNTTSVLGFITPFIEIKCKKLGLLSMFRLCYPSYLIVDEPNLILFS